MELKEYLNVPGILEKINVQPGNQVADLGCGTGYFTFPAAKMVGTGGRVYAVDVQKHVLENIKSRASMEGLGNVLTVWSDLEIVGAAKEIYNNSLDFAFLVNVFYQNTKSKELLKEAIRMTKPSGRILVIDWKKEPTPFGPTLDTRVTPEDIEKIAVSLGLQVTGNFEAGVYHWGLLFSK